MSASTAPTTMVVCRCGKTFEVLDRVIRQGRGKNCSKRCAAAGMAGRPLGVRYLRICPCGREFSLSPSKCVAGRGKYCSVPCANTYRSNPLPSGVRVIVPEITYQAVPDMRIQGPALPPRLDMLLMRDLRHTGRRIWWPGVSDRCTPCGGRLSLYPPSDGALGWVSCDACSREPYEVAM